MSQCRTPKKARQCMATWRRASYRFLSPVEAQDEWELFSPSFVMTSEPKPWLGLWAQLACRGSGASIQLAQLALKQSWQSHFVKFCGFLMSGMLGIRESRALPEPPSLLCVVFRVTVSSFFLVKGLVAHCVNSLNSLNASGITGVFLLDQGRDIGTQWTGKIRQCGYSFLVLAMRTEPSRCPQCSRTGTVSRGVHDRSAGRFASVLRPRRPGGQSPSSLLQGGNWIRKLGISSSESWWTTDASTWVSSNRAVPCTSCCSPAARPRHHAPGSAIPSNAPLVQWPDAKWAFSQSSRPWRQVFECSGTDSKTGHSARGQIFAHDRSQSSQHFPQPTTAVSSSTEPERSELADHSHAIAAWTPVSLRSTTANWTSFLQRH